jgi:hypothetical protein
MEASSELYLIWRRTRDLHFFVKKSSVSESLTQGIPLIIWPVGGEQPINGAFLSAEPNPVAIELFQVLNSFTFLPC